MVAEDERDRRSETLTSRAKPGSCVLVYGSPSRPPLLTRGPGPRSDHAKRSITVLYTRRPSEAGLHGARFAAVLYGIFSPLYSTQNNYGSRVPTVPVSTLHGVNLLFSTRNVIRHVNYGRRFG
jgi:hypothetical protein